MLKRVASLLLVVVLLAACSKPTPVAQGVPVLTWTGAALAGSQFYERVMPNVTVHYTPPTTPEVAERLGTAMTTVMDQQIRYGRGSKYDRIHVWVVPEGVAWPQGITQLPFYPAIRAANSGTVITYEGIASLQTNELAAAGGTDAVGLALTQPAGSPVFAVDWLAVGTGGVLARDWPQFPGTFWRENMTRPYSAFRAAPLLEALQKADNMQTYTNAARALAALVMDRWGANWAWEYSRKPEELTPAAALLWATGARDPASAVALWQERMTSGVQQIVPNASTPDQPVLSAADISPVRVDAPLKALPVGPGPNANYSPQTYDIRAKYEPTKQTVEGEQLLTWENGEGVEVDTLYFNLWPNADQYARYQGGIKINTVAVDGKPATFRAQALDLVVPLGRGVKPGEKAEVKITFTTRVPVTITHRVFGQNGTDLFNLAHWFPILAPLDDRGWVLHPLPDRYGEPYSENAHYRVTLDVPAGTVVGATGQQKSKQVQGNRWVYQYEAPNVRDWALSGGQKVKEVTRKVDDVTIRVIHTNTAEAEKVGAETEYALRLFEPKFGPYPWPDLVVVPCCAGLEYPGLFYIFSANDPRDAWKVTTYHELAHEWFYGSVGNDQYNEAWLDEGFARYGERIGVRRIMAQPAALKDISKVMLADPLRVNSSTTSFTVRGSYVAAVYDKGAQVLENLEALVGEETFTRILREYTSRFRFKTATTADFVALAQEISGRDLSAFFREHQINPSLRAPYVPVLPLGQAVMSDGE